MAEMIYLYDGSFTGFLCCIFDSYVNKEVLTAIYCDEDFSPTLFPCRSIPTDQGHAERVLKKVASSSPYAEKLLRRGFLTCLPEKELHLYHLVKKLLQEGPAFLRNASDETLLPVFQAVRHLSGEVHQLKGFIRFSELGGVLGSEIEPKNRVLPLLSSHFCARYPDARFFIYDRTHKEALFASAGSCVIRALDGFQMVPPDDKEARYRLLWKRFYDTIAIKERTNLKCRMTNMPKRYWSTMTEFQGDSYFKGQRSPSAAAIPCAPDGRSAPGTPSKSGPSAPGSIP